MSNPYHEDDTLNWLAAQFAEGILQPSSRAENAFQEIVLLRDLAEKTRRMTDAMDGDWMSEGTERTQEVVESLEKYERWKR